MNFRFKKSLTERKKVNNGWYYILLGVCMILTGGMWYIAASHMPAIPKESTTQIASSQVTSEYIPPAIATPKQPAPPKILRDDYVMPVAAIPQEESITLEFIHPMVGDILTDYAKETLVYSNTMQDWRCHEAIDYRGEMGSQVKAAESGIIESITTDEMQGTVITIRHADDILTRYSGLQEKTIVTEGQEVQKGAIIGGIGVSGAFEIAEPPHLHFEVIVDEKNINPHDVLD